MVCCDAIVVVNEESTVHETLAGCGQAGRWLDLELSSESWKGLEKEGKRVDRHGTGDQARSKPPDHSLGSLRTQWYLFSQPSVADAACSAMKELLPLEVPAPQHATPDAHA